MWPNFAVHEPKPRVSCSTKTEIEQKYHILNKISQVYCTVETLLCLLHLPESILIQWAKLRQISPIGVEFWLKTVTFWLDRAPARSGSVACPCPLKKIQKYFFQTKKMIFKKSLGSSRVHQEAQIWSQKQIPLEFGLRVANLVSGRFFWIPPRLVLAF